MFSPEGLDRGTLVGAIGSGTGSTFGRGTVGGLNWKKVFRVQSAEFVFVPMSVNAVAGVGFLELGLQRG